MLQYEVWINKGKNFYALFYTKAISGTSDVGEPVSSEIEGGAAFNSIRVHRQIKILMGNYAHAAHQLFLLHQGSDDLTLKITFESDTQERHVEFDYTNGVPIGHLVENTSTREIAKLVLSKCKFQSIVAVQNESYEVSFKIGAMEMDVDRED